MIPVRMYQDDRQLAWGNYCANEAVILANLLT